MELFKSIFLLLLLSINIITSQSNESDINDIRSEYKNIKENMPSYSFQNVDAMGGYATVYCDNEKVRLIELTIQGETGKSVIEHYFKNEALFFTFNRIQKYNMPYYIDEKTAKEHGLPEAFDINKSTMVENRYYFKDKKLFLWLENDKEVDLNIDNNILKGEEHIKHSGGIIDRMRTENY